MRITQLILLATTTLLVMSCNKDNDIVYTNPNIDIESTNELTSAKARSGCRNALIFNRTPIATTLPFTPYNNAFAFDEKMYASKDLGEWWQSAEGISWKKVVLPKGSTNKTGFLFVFKNSLWYVESSTKIWRWGSGSKYSLVKPTWELVSIKANHPYSRGALESGYVVFKDRIWRFVGDDEEHGITQYSFDMVRWKTVDSGPSFPRRRYATYTVFNNKIWIIGGQRINSSDQGNTWYSSDGINWNAVTTGKKWLRESHATVVFDNKLWVIGGKVGETNGKCDLWFSRDGINWKEETLNNNAPFSPRDGHSSVTFKNKLWVIGGRNYNDSASEASHNEVWNMRKCSNATIGPSISK